MNDTVTIVNKGMKHLLEKIGALETEIFISYLLSEIPPAASGKVRGIARIRS